MARTRSESTHRKILESALELVAARGLEATSMDAISEASGASKATIYKHWPDKDALLLDVMATAYGLHNRPAFNSGNTRSDVVEVLAYRPKEHAELRECILPHFMAYSARHPAFGMAWRQMVMEPPRQELRRLLTQAIDEGELTRDLNVEISLSLLLGPMMYWFVFLRMTEESPDELAQAVVNCFWRAYSVSADPRAKAPKRHVRKA